MTERYELDLYFELASRLDQKIKPSEKQTIGATLTSLLRSESVSIRRCAKYELRWNFKGAPKRFSRWGPPEEAEIEYWEKRFKNYFNYLE